MARFRLRYQATDLELARPEFAVGRSSECDLALDDPLVSRRHAVFRMEGDVVSVEDLKSRNGILVNGAKVTAKTRLKHLDRVTVGSQEIVLLEVAQRAQDKRSTSIMTVCPACRLPLASTETACPHCGTTLSTSEAPASDPRATQDLRFSWTGPDEDTRKASALTLLAGVADKALALGRAEEAERILAPLLTDLLEKARRGRLPADGSLPDATRYALRLAESTGKPRWVDWVFQLHEVLERLPPADAIDTIYAIAKKVRFTGSQPLRSYVRTLKSRAAQLSANERFLLQRLEGLERVLGA